MASTSANAQRAANRRPAVRSTTSPATPVVLGRDEYRVFLLRPKQSPLEITDLGTAVSWSDSAPILTGELQIQDPSPGKPTVSVLEGDRIQLQGRTTASGVWGEVWRMRVQGTSNAIKAGTRGWSLADDLQNLADSTDDFRFVRDRAHKKGWLASEIIRVVCRRYGIPVGALPKTTYRIKRKIAKNASPIDVITDVMKTERVHTGKRFVMRFRRGKLFITPLVRSTLMYEMGPTIIEGTYDTNKAEGFATKLTVRGTQTSAKGKDGKQHKLRKPKKIAVSVSRAKIVARFGVVHRTITLKGLDSTAEARQRGLAELDKRTRPSQKFTFTHPGILGVRRGQAMRLRIPERSVAQVVWITELRHSVAVGDYSMEVTVTFTDPFKLTKADRLARTRAAKAAAKGRKADANSKKKPPKSAKSKVRT